MSRWRHSRLTRRQLPLDATRRAVCASITQRSVLCMQKLYFRKERYVERSSKSTEPLELVSRLFSLFLATQVSPLTAVPCSHPPTPPFLQQFPSLTIAKLKYARNVSYLPTRQSSYVLRYITSIHQLSLKMAADGENYE